MFTVREVKGCFGRGGLYLDYEGDDGILGIVMARV